MARPRQAPVDHSHQLGRQRPDLLRDPDADMQLERTSYASSAESVVIDATFDAVVEVAYRSLPEHFREVVSLVDVQGMTYTEAASVMETPVGTVMSRLHRARARIRKQLALAGVSRPKEEP